MLQIEYNTHSIPKLAGLINSESISYLRVLIDQLDHANALVDKVTSLRPELNDARASQISARRLKVKNARIGLNSLKAWELGLWKNI